MFNRVLKEKIRRLEEELTSRDQRVTFLEKEIAEGQDIMKKLIESSIPTKDLREEASYWLFTTVPLFTDRSET